MRGSPLLRTFLLLLVLIGTGLWIVRVTRAQDLTPPTSAPTEEIRSDTTTRTIPYRLTLSAPAAFVEIGTLDGAATNSSLRGKLEVSSDAPVLTLLVRWRDAAETNVHRFARLTLEIPGRDTIEHVFDAAGDIDDVWELPPPDPEP